MYRRHEAPARLLVGYDPVTDLPSDHLARLVEMVVEESVIVKARKPQAGQPKFDPRLCLKVLVYGYATGVRSSRQLEKQCKESLPYLFLTRGDTPSYRTLCSFRIESKDLLSQVWLGLFGVAKNLGLKRLGRIVMDSTKLRANTSSEMILARDEYAGVKLELQRILDEAEAKDKQEDAEGYAGETRTGTDVGNLQMRDILRKVRRQLSKHSEPDPTHESGAKGGAVEIDRRVFKSRKGLTARMKDRLKDAGKSIAEAESDGRQHLCLTDPDARMMHGGVEKRIRECHSLEVAVDKDCGLLVADGVTQIGNDNERLVPLVEAAETNEPEGIKAVDTDSGYFQADAVADLARRGIDTCIPDSTTACELHRGMAIGTLARRRLVLLEYDEQRDAYLCPEGNELTLRRPKKGDADNIKRYRSIRMCIGCPRYNECIVRLDGKPAKAEYKWIQVRQRSPEIRSMMERFNEPEYRQRYNERGGFVEGVHGFVRSALGFDRWLLRGKDKVQSEGKLITTAYQFRKLHLCWAGTMA